MKDTGTTLYFEQFELNPYLNEIIKEMAPIAEKNMLAIRFKENENISEDRQ